MSKNSRTLDALGDRMKMFEGIEAKRMLMPKLPILVRIDGKCFSKFTKGLERPYDKRLSALMVETTKLLVQEYGAFVGYTQSDEISLILYSATLDSQVPYNGRIQKLVGDITAFTTLHFNRMLPKYLPDEYVKRYPRFDCRVWNVPTLEEAANAILWRELDATKNSISMAAQHYFSHKVLQGKNGGEKQDMLMIEKGVNWNDYPAYFKRGTYVKRVKVSRKYTCEEIEKLPAKHQARTNPDLMVERQDVQVISMPPFNKVVNRVGVIFNEENPLLEQEQKTIQGRADNGVFA
jgi:tRNA(His) 5'-end guanylyltransferase